MRHIAAIDDGKIPRDDSEYRFRTRAKGLVDKWHQTFNANKTNGSPTTSTAGHTNGKADKENTKDNEDEVTNGAKNLDLNEKSLYWSPLSFWALLLTGIFYRG
jgi:hypothetical protein